MQPREVAVAESRFCAISAYPDLSGRCDAIEQITMAKALRRMERDGLVRRRPHPVHGRAQQVWLTRKARSLRDRALAAATAQNEFALAGLAADERQQFIEFMTRTIAAQRCGATDTRSQRSEMLDVSGKLRQALNEPGHLESASNLIRRMRSRNGPMSAARS